MPDVPTIHEMLDQILDYNRRSSALVLALKGEAPAEEPATPGPPAPPVAPPKFTNGMSAPDDLGRVELELVERLVAEFGEAPNGFRIPRLWFVDFAPISHLPEEVRGDHAMRVKGAGFNKNLAYTYVTEIDRGFFGKTITRRVPRDVIPSCLAWFGSLADLEAALRARIQLLLTYPAYVRNPDQSEALNSVAGYIDLKTPIA